MATVTSTLQFKLNGVWVDIADVRSRAGITARRGIMGSGVNDRVAAVGTITFSLDNSINNSGGLQGYYSPDHANKRAYFTDGIPVRWKLVSGANTRYVFHGRIASIEPTPGLRGDHSVEVTAEDFMSHLLDIKLDKIEVQIDKRTDQIVAIVVTNIGVSPLNTAYDVTPDTFAYSLDDEGDESTAPMTVLQKAVQSDASLLYVTGNTTDGETLVLTSRNTRAAETGTAATLSDTMSGLVIKRGKDNIYNDVVCSVANRRVDTDAVILWAIDSEMELPPASPVTITARYIDPDSRAERISKYPGSEVTPVADTDYRMSSVAGNSANDLNADLSISVTWGGNTAEVTLENTGSVLGFLNLFQLRAKGMYLYSRQDVRVQDATSISTYGRRTLSFNLPYQTSVNVAADIARSILERYKDPVTHISGVDFIANYSNALMTAALTCDIGDRIYLSETVTGIAGYFFITSVEFSYEDGALLRVSWGLSPADVGSAWILGDATLSVLGSTTIPNMFV